MIAGMLRINPPGIDQVYQNACALNMPQKLSAQTGALMGENGLGKDENKKKEQPAINNNRLEGMDRVAGSGHTRG